MKRINLFLIMVLLTGLAMAQKPIKKEVVTPQAQAQKMTRRMEKDLSLSPQQTREVQILNLEFASQMKAVSLDKKELRNKVACDSCKKIAQKQKMVTKNMHTEIKENKEAREAKLKTILTKEQYELYQKNMEQRTHKKDSLRLRRE